MNPRSISSSDTQNGQHAHIGLNTHELTRSTIAEVANRAPNTHANAMNVSDSSVMQSTKNGIKHTNSRGVKIIGTFHQHDFLSLSGVETYGSHAPQQLHIGHSGDSSSVILVWEIALQDFCWRAETAKFFSKTKFKTSETICKYT